MNTAIVDVYGQDGCPDCEEIKAMVRGLPNTELREHTLAAHLEGHERWRECDDVALAAYVYENFEDGDIPLPIVRFSGKCYAQGFCWGDLAKKLLATENWEENNAEVRTDTGKKPE